MATSQTDTTFAGQVVLKRGTTIDPAGVDPATVTVDGGNVFSVTDTTGGGNIETINEASGYSLVDGWVIILENTEATNAWTVDEGGNILLSTTGTFTATAATADSICLMYSSAQTKWIELWRVLH